MNNLTVTKSKINTTNQTPIEIALQIDAEGCTTTRKLYEFLELELKNYSHWIKRNILNNPFAVENVDFTPLVFQDDNSQTNNDAIVAKDERTNTGFKNPKPTQDFKIIASFAKRLAMASNSPKGELARNYFIKVENTLKELAITVVPTYNTALEKINPYLLLYMEQTNAALKILNQKLDTMELLLDPKKRREEAERKYREFVAACKANGVSPSDVIGTDK
jgi:phage anti-repressor protein